MPRPARRKKRDARRVVFLDYVYAVAHRCGRSDHEFVLVDEQPDEGDWADITAVPGRKLFHVSVSDELFDRPKEEICHITTHEILHTYMVEMEEAIHDVADHVGADVLGPLLKKHRRAEEHTVDDLAKVLAPWMPVPPDPLGCG